MQDRGLLYGDGCFTTIRVTASGVPFYAAHKRRMQVAAERLAIPFDDHRFDALLAARRAQEGVLRITLTRGLGGRGYRLPEDGEPCWHTTWRSPPRLPASWLDNGLVLTLCDVRLAHQPVLAGIKHLNRLEQVLARQQVDERHADEGLMLDRDSRVIELTAMNLFARFGDRLRTPDLGLCGVAGVMREHVLTTLAPAAAVPVDIGTLTLSELRLADEVFACNSVIGIVPVTRLGVWRWPMGTLGIGWHQEVNKLWQSGEAC